MMYVILDAKQGIATFSMLNMFIFLIVLISVYWNADSPLLEINFTL